MHFTLYFHITCTFFFIQYQLLKCCRPCLCWNPVWFSDKVGLVSNLIYLPLLLQEIILTALLRTIYTLSHLSLYLMKSDFIFMLCWPLSHYCSDLLCRARVYEAALNMLHVVQVSAFPHSSWQWKKKGQKGSGYLPVPCKLAVPGSGGRRGSSFYLSLHHIIHQTLTGHCKSQALKWGG